ncbi:MAG: diheme cytochrome c [Myxococcota bacterium]|nr:diheme cytochrome c [Myxococcota bacterium]
MKGRWVVLGVLAAAALAVLPLTSRADDDDEERSPHRRRGGEAAARDSPVWKTYEAECGGCHLAYPPRMLPGASWAKLLGGLEDHFGQNAELDAQTREVLRTYLEANAGPDRGETPLRITELRFWRREHRKLPAEVWRRKAVGTRANCQACHRSADQGSFDEDGVRIPKG